jgi:hypothetical protein
MQNYKKEKKNQERYFLGESPAADRLGHGTVFEG